MPTPRALDTMQTIYTRAAQHILRQKGGSFRTVQLESSTVQNCAYRGEGGCKCAVGLFISDEFCTPALEGKTVSASLVEAAVAATLPLRHLTFDDRGHVFSLLMSLQVAHDMSFSPLALGHGSATIESQREGYAREMFGIARDFNLIPVAALNKWLEA